MTIREALSRASAELTSAGVETPYLDAVLLLCHALGISKESLFRDLREPLGEEPAGSYRELLDRRLSGLPVSYIRGVKEFYGREFLVDPRVLVPRPDTEVLVDAALSIVARDAHVQTVHDCCTGSGCVAITLKAEAPRLTVSASDLSADALDVAAENCRRLLGFGAPAAAAARGNSPAPKAADESSGAPDRSIPLCRSDLLNDVACPFDLITANPPYLTSEEYAQMRRSGWPEPAMALDGGTDGLDLVRRLVSTAVDCLNQNGYLCVETADPQSSSVRTIMVNAGFADVETHVDLAGRGRVTVGRKPE
ncbi:peptide chain release factor N(5)-glutamine methyltransferase [Salinispira pacifica]